ncbi:MAG: DUF4338 domain-containing protein [Desulfovermiculus sp.]|nr:DUF4338 domain-containing protein [Desulfovermiculus sp.]
MLPEWHIPNLGSKVLSLVQKCIVHDWQKNFGHPVLLVETFVDPRHFHGCVYKAANWTYVGNTKGYRRTRRGYTFQTNRRVGKQLGTEGSSAFRMPYGR